VPQEEAGSGLRSTPAATLSAAWSTPAICPSSSPPMGATGAGLSA